MFERPSSVRNAGFTLLEISIVLVIIGLIVGGIVVGGELIYAAEVRKAVSQIESVQTAVNTFRLKYGQPPGDITNAALYWSTAVGGDGNGFISTAESVTFWDHLSQAEINPLPPNHQSALGGAYIHVISTAAMIDQGGNKIELLKASVAATAFDFLMGLIGQSIAMGGRYTIGIQSTDAWMLDVKVDDGLPESGKAGLLIRAASFNPLYDCASPNGAPNGMSTAYDSTMTTQTCAFVIRLAM